MDLLTMDKCLSLTAFHLKMSYKEVKDVVFEKYPPYEKEVAIDTLIQELKKCWVSSISIISAKFKDYKAGNIIKLSIRENRGKKYYSISGPDTMYLQGSVINTVVTKRGNVRRQKAPYRRNIGYMLWKNQYNLAYISNLQHCIDKFNRIYEDYEISEKPPLNKKTGILGWDVPYKEAPWLQKMLPGEWNPHFNPKSLTGGVWLFQKCSFCPVGVSKAMKFLRTQKKNGKKVWSSLLPVSLGWVKGGPGYAGTKGPLNVEEQKKVWAQFLTKPKFTSALVVWAGHARFIYKSGREITVYDPWKNNVDRTPTFRAIRDYVSRYGFHLKFHHRKAEQGNEGSCAVIAFMRAILVAEYGQKGTEMEVPPDYAVLASRLISKFR